MSTHNDLLTAIKAIEATRPGRRALVVVTDPDGDLFCDMQWVASPGLDAACVAKQILEHMSHCDVHEGGADEN